MSAKVATTMEIIEAAECSRIRINRFCLFLLGFHGFYFAWAFYNTVTGAFGGLGTYDFGLICFGWSIFHIQMLFRRTRQMKHNMRVPVLWITRHRCCLCCSQWMIVFGYGFGAAFAFLFQSPLHSFIYRFGFMLGWPMVTYYLIDEMKHWKQRLVAIPYNDQTKEFLQGEAERGPRID